MNPLQILIKRNTKLFFKDKGMFFTALITPLILLVLYATFLGNVYRDSFLLSLPEGMQISERVINGCVGGQLISSILAVSCVTVAFCSNLLMVQDRANGTIRDLTVSPIRAHTLSLGYYVATLISTMIVCLFATALCLGYVATVGWFFSLTDVLLLFLDVVLLVMFGTALSSVVYFFLSTQGQMSAVGSIVSSTYGFVCGAYMPLSQFSEGLRNLLGFFPGTYGTSLFKNQTLRGVCEEMSKKGFPDMAVEAVKDMADCNMYVFGHGIEQWFSYAVMIGAVVLLVGAYVLINVLSARQKRRFSHGESEKKMKN